MNNSRKQQSVTDREVDDQPQSTDDSTTGSYTPTAISRDSSATSNGNDVGFADRLTDLLVGDGNDSDMLMQRNTERGTVMRWLQALDVHVIGACRADERLKPLLKVNNHNGSSVVEDRLLSHLSQHFEPLEVGLLARCLCIPLASVRVGKVKKQGTLLTPTNARGNLVISFLPSSDLCLSFLSDDGYTETLSVLRNISDCSSVMIEGIPADSSGRSFVVRIPNKDPFYFWCSEKSRLLGNELLEKMKNLLERKPSLAELTGISDSRLERFVHHLRANFVRSHTSSEDGQTSQSQNLLSKPARPPRTCNFQVVLSPRPSSFKLRRRTDGGRIETSEKHPVPCPSTSNHGKRKLLDSSSGTCLFPSLPVSSSTSAPQISPPYYCWCPPIVSVSTLQTESFTLPPLSVSTLQTESFTLPPLSSLLPKPSPNLSEIPFLPLSMPTSSQQISVFTPLMCDPIVHLPVMDICTSGQAYLVNSGPAISVSIPPQISPPYYCWCPPIVSVSTLQNESFTLPPLSSLLPKPSPNLSEIPFLPLSMPTSSQQISVFTPLMCDPIVHLPVMDICSSGQAYLVNSGPAISVSIPPLIQERSESEKSARDTLRILISGSGQLPSVITKSDDMGLVSAGIMRCIEQGEISGTGLNKDDPSEGSSRE